MFNESKVTDTLISVKTNWAEFDFAQVEDGRIYQRAKGYSLGSLWTEWEATKFTTLEKAKEGVITFYGEKVD